MKQSTASVDTYRSNGSLEKSVVVDYKDCKGQNDQKHENSGLSDVRIKLSLSETVFLIRIQSECQPFPDFSKGVHLSSSQRILCNRETARCISFIKCIPHRISPMPPIPEILILLSCSSTMLV